MPYCLQTFNEFVFLCEQTVFSRPIVKLSMSVYCTFILSGSTRFPTPTRVLAVATLLYICILYVCLSQLFLYYCYTLTYKYYINDYLPDWSSVFFLSSKVRLVIELKYNLTLQIYLFLLLANYFQIHFTY